MVTRLVALALAASGLLLAACADSPSARIIVAERGLYSGAVSPDGRYAAVGSLIHGGSLWRLSDGERLYDWNLRADRQIDSFTVFTDMAFSGNGQRVASARERELVVWSVNDGSSLNFFEAPSVIRSVALDQRGNRMLLGLQDGTAAVFNVSSGELVQRLSGHRGAVQTAQLSADGRFAVTGSDDLTAIFWAVDDGVARQRFQHDNLVRSVALSANGTYALSAAHGENAQVWRTRDGQTVRTLGTARSVVSVARFVGSDKRVLIGDRRNGVRLFDLESQRQLRAWNLGNRGLYARESQVVLDVQWAGDQAVALSSGGILAILR